MRHGFRRAQAAVDSLRIDIRSDHKTSDYDSDSSDDSPSPTKSKFPEGATITASAPEKMPRVTTTASATDPNLGVPMVTSPAAQSIDAGQPTVLQQKPDVNSKGMTQTDIIIAFVSVAISATVFAVICVYLKRRRRARARASQLANNMPQGHQEPPDKKGLRLNEEAFRKLSSMQRPDSETLPVHFHTQAPKSRVPSATPTAWPTSLLNPPVIIHTTLETVQPYPRMTPAPVLPHSQVASIAYYPINPSPAGIPPPAVTKQRISMALTEATGRTSGTWNTWGIEQHR